MSLTMVDKGKVDLFHDSLNYALEKNGFQDLRLREKQYEVLKSIVLGKRDVLAVLPTGYGKSLIYQLLPSVMDFMNREGRPSEEDPQSTVLVVSPLNALMHDQIVKMKDSGGKVCILKGDRVAADGDEVLSSLDLPVGMETTSYGLIFAHPEVLVENTKILKVIKSPAFKNKVKVIVIDEAHLVNDW